jgi:hypothetical protein
MRIIERRLIMRKQLNFLAVAALAIGGVTFTGNAQDVANKADRAGDKVDRAADKTGDALNRGIDKTGDAAQRGVDRLNRNDNAVAGNPAQFPAGIQATKNDDVEDIQSVLGQVAEASLTKDGFDDLVERFVDADRNRIGPWVKDKNRNWATLNGRVDQFQKDWKAKYGQDFDVKHAVVFGSGFQGFTIAQGEIVNPQLLSNWPVPQSNVGGGLNRDLPRTDVKIDTKVDVKNDGKVDGLHREGKVDVKNDGKIDGLDRAADKTGAALDKAGDKIQQGAAKTNENLHELGKPSDKPKDRNLDKGRNVAIVNFPASHGAQMLTVSMIHELPDNWKIDVPDNVDGQVLYDNLLTHLTAVGDMKDKWPDDVNEGYRMVSHHVLMAVYGIPHK